MRRAGLPLLIALLVAALWAGGLRPPGAGPAPDTAPDAGIEAPATGDLPGDGGRDEPAADLASAARGTNPWLPAEALATLALIDAGGPFPYRRDGVTFENREGRLPDAPRGHYREYTVPTPGSRDRGARRIVAGGNPPDAFWYTADHYRSFRRIEGIP
jgi:guanyl-specific ribonuclease Sa